jgi:predicted negative regulator of RcsB-dependent stress response
VAIAIKSKYVRANQQVRLFLCATFLITAFPVHAQYYNTKPLNQAYDYLLNYRIDSCQFILRKSPKNPYNYYLQLLATSVKLVIADDEILFKSLKNEESEFLSAVESEQFSKAEKSFLLAEARLQWGLIKLKYGEEFSAFWNIKQAYSLAKATNEEFPEYLPIYKTLGLLRAMLGLVPEKYNWVLSLFGMQGDLDEGLQELQNVAQFEKDFSLEAHLTLAMIQGYLLGDQAKSVAEMRLVYAKRKSILTNYLYSLLLMKNSASSTAMEVINNTDGKNRFAYFSYLTGEILLQQGHYSEAISAYEYFRKASEGQSLLKDATYKTALCFYLSGDESSFSEIRSKVHETGATKNEADKYAQSEVILNNLSHPDLYRLRFATDGGYFDLAKSILQGVDQSKLSTKDRCEYHYRAARLFHKTNQLSVAKESYTKAITSQGTNNWYFAPNAALQLAQIFIDEQKFDDAKKALKQLDTYRGYPYESSIRQHAKSLRNSLD